MNATFKYMISRLEVELGLFFMALRKNYITERDWFQGTKSKFWKAPRPKAVVISWKYWVPYAWMSSSKNSTQRESTWKGMVALENSLYYESSDLNIGEFYEINSFK